MKICFFPLDQEMFIVFFFFLMMSCCDLFSHSKLNFTSMSMFLFIILTVFLKRSFSKTPQDLEAPNSMSLLAYAPENYSCRTVEGMDFCVRGRERQDVTMATGRPIPDHQGSRMPYKA